MNHHSHPHTRPRTPSPFDTACLALMLAALLPPPLAQAATGEQAARPNQTWRCKAPSGLISYSQQACPNDGELVTFKDARTRGQQRQAKDNIERDTKLARRMQHERRHDERAAEKESSGPIGLSSGPHVIQSTPNNHDPVPISEMSKPIRIKSKKKAATSTAQPSSGTQAATF